MSTHISSSLDRTTLRLFWHPLLCTLFNTYIFIIVATNRARFAVGAVAITVKAFATVTAHPVIFPNARQYFFLPHGTSSARFAWTFSRIVWKCLAFNTCSATDIVDVFNHTTAFWEWWCSRRACFTVLAVSPTFASRNNILIILTFGFAVLCCVHITLFVKWHILAPTSDLITPIRAAPLAGLTFTCQILKVKPLRTCVLALRIRIQSAVLHDCLVISTRTTRLTGAYIFMCRVCFSKNTWLALISCLVVFDFCATLWKQTKSS